MDSLKAGRVVCATQEHVDKTLTVKDSDNRDLLAFKRTIEAELAR